MSHHRNAKLGLAGRYALVCSIEGGMSLKAAAVAFNVSPATAHRWWHRWLDASDDARAALSFDAAGSSVAALGADVLLGAQRAYHELVPESGAAYVVPAPRFLRSAPPGPGCRR